MAGGSVPSSASNGNDGATPWLSQAAQEEPDSPDTRASGKGLDPEKVLISNSVANRVGDPIIGWMATQMPPNRATQLGWLLKFGIRKGMGSLF